MSTNATPDQALRAQLRQALRHGPFPAALHLAIEASGLTLDQIQVRLVEQGARVSVPTLSYWRRGRSRPERPGSIRAVRCLEHLLDLPADSLVALLGPVRPRGRWIGHVTGSTDMGKLFETGRAVEMLTEVGVPPRGALTRISTQVTVTIDSHRRTSSIHLRELVVANVDRLSRCGVIHITQEDPANPPTLAGVRFCRAGRVRMDDAEGVTAAELILDRVLDAGERALVEYEWRFDPGVRMLNYEYRFQQPIREFVLQTRFEPGVIPAQCHRYARQDVSGAEEDRTELWIGSSNTALVAESDVPSGIVGMRWQWS
ncbi:hypothetical protein [Kibdelosporangium phytohabitans]|uniref:Uncharacterized protein n=1 Tax=Kibdelosporangium phytohabitans TaxID=860235 RepID=A0A0N9HYQ5_9PSEU|nr:hypothetical protein [Kibdelosporangium phytohabitans]ALG07019.1 hypothetical protein AOZ06_08835 [Kibdelosporangium phytohabitans]MBE1468310.1 hypothetical protein [Kibdelosporangium phytohabitans]